MNFRTPLGKARGLGTAKMGAGDWWAQRVTAVALIPLSLWSVWFLSRLLELSHAEMVTWLTRPGNVILLVAYLGAGFYHAMLGLKVVIEDYVHSQWLRTASLIVMQLALALLALTAAFAVLRLLFAV